MNKSLALLVLLMAVQGCAKTVARGPAPVLAVFNVWTHKARLPRAVVETLHEHATSLMAETGIYRVVPRTELLKGLARRRRGSEKRCHRLACQAKLGPRLWRADKSLSTKVVGAVMSQCNVTTELYDLAGKFVEHAARTAAPCQEAPLIVAVSKALCQMVAQRRAGISDASPSPATRPDRRCMAQADLVRVERELTRLVTLEMRGDPSEQEARLGEQMLELKRQYDGLAVHGYADITTVARCRVGKAYDMLADRIARGLGSGRTPVAVRRMGRAAIEAHEVQQQAARDQRAQPFRTRAIEVYRRCVTEAEQRGVAHRYLVEARARFKVLGGKLEQGPGR